MYLSFYKPMRLALCSAVFKKNRYELFNTEIIRNLKYACNNFSTSKRIENIKEKFKSNDTLYKMPYTKHGDKNIENIVLQPYNYLLQTEGKNVRSKLIKAFTYLMNIPEEKLYTISEIVNILQNASLLIDDMEDNSPLRRGVTTAHCVFGLPATLNASNFVLFIALEKVLSLNNNEVVQIFLECMLSVHTGQGMDIYYRDNFICPTEEQYKEIAKQKTGALFLMAAKLMQVYSDNKSDLNNLLNNLGIHYQISNDYCNLCDEECIEKKSYCEDLSEGKFSFPIIHALRNNPNDQEIINILKQRTTDVVLKKHCVSLLKKYGSLDYTLNVLKELEADMKQELKAFEGHAEFKMCFEKILKEMKLEG